MDKRTTLFCFLLICLILGSGCLERQRSEDAGSTISQNQTKLSIPITATPNINSINCSIPVLKFNNSQEVTRNFGGVVFQPLTTDNNFHNTVSNRGTVPLGVIVYHEQGFTRFFDSSGNQVMIVNDTESTLMTPEGPMSASYEIGVQEDERLVGIRNDTWVVYSATRDTCVGAVIRKPGVNPPYTFNMGP